MELLLLKLGVTAAVVLGLSLLAEYGSPRLAGFFSAYPTGSAISLFFFGLEQGNAFASHSALYNILGLVGTLGFVYGYYLASRACRRCTVLRASLGGILVYAAALVLLQPLQLGPLETVLLTGAVIVGCVYLFRPIPNHALPKRIPLSWRVAGWRVGFSAALVVLVTGLAGRVGSDWAGLFSSFPLTVYPLLVVLHHAYGEVYAHTVLKNLPRGLGAVVAYSLVVFLAYPLYGVYAGSLLAFAAATLYVLLYWGVEWGLRRWQRARGVSAP